MSSDDENDSLRNRRSRRVRKNTSKKTERERNDKKQAEMTSVVDESNLTFKSVTDTTVNETFRIEKDLNLTFEVKEESIRNRSGEWIVEKTRAGPDRVHLHKKSASPSTSLRKGLRFETSIMGSPTLKHTTYSELKASKSILTSSPIDSPNSTTRKKWVKLETKPTESPLLKRARKSNFTNSVVKKSTVKSIPNFSEIHKRAYDKMESLRDYSDRKKERAQDLLLGRNPKKQISKDLFSNLQSEIKRIFDSPKPLAIQTPKSSAKPLRLNNSSVVIKKKKSPLFKPLLLAKSMKENMVSKIPKTIKPIASVQPTVFHMENLTVQPPKKIEPKSVFSTGRALAVANKTKTTDRSANINHRRDQIKGVRTNRRFELLMKMRNNS